MAKIYLVRHGESVANTKGIYQGQTYDTSLSLLGKKQAKMLGKYFKNIKLDVIYSSPLKRTFETATNIAINYVPQLDVLNENMIIETNHGLWEGLHKQVIMNKWPDMYRAWQINPSNVIFPDGEPFIKTVDRTLKWWKNFSKKDGNYLVITHDNIVRIIVAYIKGMDLDDIWKISLNNAAITLVEVGDNKNQSIIYVGKTDHIKNLLADLSKHAL